MARLSPMRFLRNGPSIPDDLLIARDAGDVIFFCGAGVSRQAAGLPDFLKLGGDVIDRLGAGERSLARKLFRRIEALDPIDGVGGLIATDRIFSLLEREFVRRDVQIAVARAIQPSDTPDLSAHRNLIDLSRSRDGTVRLVTTNFDLLFEAAAPDLASSGPPVLPDPRGAGFGGIVHLHGRVSADYSGPGDEEFIVSSADFGRAYLSDGWATRFMQSLLARFQIVFVGYGADDPPVQYLLEALNLHAGNRSRLFAFQPGNNADGAALWEHRGVRAIQYDNSANRHDSLWDSLAAWAERARDVDGWYDRLLSTASVGPAALDPHVRGQIAHVLSTREGARRVSIAASPLPASWLLTLDPHQRFEEPGPIDPYGESVERIDPYESLSLDFDIPPQPVGEGDAFRERKVPEGSWSAFAPTRFDQEDSHETGFGDFRGNRSHLAGPLSKRLSYLGIWFHRVAHEPVALWWAAASGPLHPWVVELIESRQRKDRDLWPDDIWRGWRFLIASWSDRQVEPVRGYLDLSHRVAREGWSEARVRDYAAIFRPRLTVDRKFDVPHPLSWTDGNWPIPLVSCRVDYPHPHELLPIPDEHLAYAVVRFRENLDLARSLEAEVSGSDYVYLHTTRPDDGAPPIAYDSYGVTGPIALFLQLMERMVEFAPERAHSEIAQWPENDHFIFGRLRIWGASKRIVPAGEAANILLGLPDAVFWGANQQRDLLYAIRDRWTDFTAEDRDRFERRILTTTFPWPDTRVDGKARSEAHYRLDRLRWLSQQGLNFSFDVEAKMAELRLIAVEWTERSGDRAADSHAPIVRSIGTNTDPRVLDDVPISEILSRAEEAAQRDFFDDEERRPFSGLSEESPSRALAALTDAARNGDVPINFWSAFLYASKRKTDSERFARAIAGRLASLPAKDLSNIVYPVTTWLHDLDERLFSDLTDVLDRLWGPLMAALPLQSERRRHRVDSSWANDGLNAPAGKLASLLLMDPSTKNRELGQGFPEAWTRRFEQLLELPGDMRRHALVMLGFRLNWLFAIDPHWTDANLLKVIDDPGDDGDALWDGIFWRARTPSRALYERLKPELVKRALSPMRRRAEANVVGAFLLVGWRGNPEADPPEQLISSAELREILVDSDDELRGQILWHLEHGLDEPDAWSRECLVPFLKEVWPNHRSLRTPEMSIRLGNLALASRDLFPRVVQLILPRLVPVRGGFLRGLLHDLEAEDQLARNYPKAMLDLLWASLAEDASLWPYKVEKVLDILAEAADTKADPRLSELRRRRAS